LGLLLSLRNSATWLWGSACRWSGNGSGFVLGTTKGQANLSMIRGQMKTLSRLSLPRTRRPPPSRIHSAHPVPDRGVFPETKVHPFLRQKTWKFTRSRVVHPCLRLTLLKLGTIRRTSFPQTPPCPRRARAIKTCRPSLQSCSAFPRALAQMDPQRVNRGGGGNDAMPQ